jgi:hypothetical protein
MAYMTHDYSIVLPNGIASEGREHHMTYMTHDYSIVLPNGIASEGREHHMTCKTQPLPHIEQRIQEMHNISTSTLPTAPRGVALHSQGCEARNTATP